MIILVDMDGVLADYNGAVHKILAKEFGNLIPKDKFYIKERYEGKYHKEIDKICSKKNFFATLKPIEGAIKALNEMKRAGHEVIICSSFFTEYPDSLNGKTKWVIKHLGEEWRRKLVFSKDKTIITGNVLIDDKPEIKGIRQPSWKVVIFNQPYNKNITGKRLKSWDDWKSIID